MVGAVFGNPPATPPIPPPVPQIHDVNVTNFPPDIAHAIDVGSVPPGVPVSLLLESRDNPTKIGIYFMFSLTFVFLLLRCYSRAFVVRKFGLDDWLACVTFVRLFLPRHATE
jgi:hypothetical protein